ncbi:MAG: hypothetical protein GX458_20160 [Phyllobacteriaceae bacterium]|nr:hypothetical protein [Phyllobacteriaceae bacterium]
MSGLERGLGAIARNGRAVLALSLVVGIASPTLAGAIRPHIGPLVAILIAFAAFRIGWRAALGALDALPRTLGLVVLTQVAMPLMVWGIETASGLTGPIALALLIMTTTAPIAGTPNLTLLVGADPAPALRILVVATGLLPLTVIPVFLVSGALGDPAAVMPAALRLTGLIVAATGIGFAVRAFAAPTPSRRRVAAIDGASALVMGVLVIGLMEAVGRGLRVDPLGTGGIALAAFAANFGLQIASALACRRFGTAASAPAIGISVGNRNFILLLTALPDALTQPIMPFVGCYQIPMYLTPLLLAGFHRAVGRAPDGAERRG